MKIKINLFETLLRMTMRRSNLSQQRSLNKDNYNIKKGGLMNSHWHRTTRRSVSIFSAHLSSILYTLLAVADLDLEQMGSGGGGGWLLALPVLLPSAK